MAKLLTNAAIAQLFDRLAAHYPAPETELEYHDPYTLVVAVALSAQATDVGVNKATRGLFAKVRTPQQMVALGEAGLKEYIKTIGLFNGKAKNIIAMSHKLINEFGGEVPNDRKALESLPGVGQKTAAVVMNVAFGEPTLAVDTHVFRTSNRFAIVRSKTPDQTEAPLTKKLKKILPHAHMMDAHHYLILHGRYVCKARKPDCGNCVVEDICQFTKKVFD